MQRKMHLPLLCSLLVFATHVPFPSPSSPSGTAKAAPRARPATHLLVAAMVLWRLSTSPFPSAQFCAQFLKEPHCQQLLVTGTLHVRAKSFLLQGPTDGLNLTYISSPTALDETSYVH